jgi:hypothetical protein
MYIYNTSQVVMHNTIDYFVCGYKWIKEKERKVDVDGWIIMVKRNLFQNIIREILTAPSYTGTGR